MELAVPFRKYAALFVVLVGGSLIVNVGIEMYRSHRDSREALISVQRDRAQSAAAAIEQFVKGVEGQVGTTALLPAGSSVDQRRFDFLRFLRQTPAITELSYLDEEGREQLKVSRLAMDRLASGADLSQDPKFTQARANKRYLSPIYFRKVSEPYLTIAIAGTGRAVGVTVAEVNVRLISDVISRINVGRSGAAYVVDERGLLIAHSDTSAVLNKTDMRGLPHVAQALSKLRDASVEVPTISRDHLGRDVLTVSASIGALDSLVFLDVPLSETLHPIYEPLRWTFMLALGLGLAAMASIWLRTSTRSV